MKNQKINMDEEFKECLINGIQGYIEKSEPILGKKNLKVFKKFNKIIKREELGNIMALVSLAYNLIDRMVINNDFINESTDDEEMDDDLHIAIDDMMNKLSAMFPGIEIQTFDMTKEPSFPHDELTPLPFPITNQSVSSRKTNKKELPQSIKWVEADMYCYIQGDNIAINEELFDCMLRGTYYQYTAPFCVVQDKDETDHDTPNPTLAEMTFPSYIPVALGIDKDKLVMTANVFQMSNRSVINIEWDEDRKNGYATFNNNKRIPDGVYKVRLNEKERIFEGTIEK